MKFFCAVMIFLTTIFSATTQAAPVTVGITFSTPEEGTVGSGSLTYDDAALLDVDEEYWCPVDCQGLYAYRVERFRIGIYDFVFSDGSAAPPSLPAYLFSPSRGILELDYYGNPPRNYWGYEGLETIFWFTDSYFAYQSASSGGVYHEGSVSFSLPPPSEVPLPAAAWLMIAGLGGIWAAGRKRNKRCLDT